MPKYVYQNLNTGEHYELEQSFHDAAYTHHPLNGEPVKRLIFAPAVIFKGSGWYAKDSQAGSAKTEAKSPDKAEGSEAKSDGSAAKPQADAKNESKAESKVKSSPTD